MASQQFPFVGLLACILVSVQCYPAEGDQIAERMFRPGSRGTSAKIREILTRLSTLETVPESLDELQEILSSVAENQEYILDLLNELTGNGPEEPEETTSMSTPGSEETTTPETEETTNPETEETTTPETEETTNPETEETTTPEFGVKRRLENLLDRLRQRALVDELHDELENEERYDW